MFILSVGLIKSGSTLLSWYQKEIIMKYYGERSQRILESFISCGMFKGKGHYISIDSDEIITELIDLSIKNGPFLVKTHSPLSDKIADEIKKGNIFTSCIHRDPRDVILSSIDHGKRTDFSNDLINPFLQYRSIEESSKLVKLHCNKIIEWIDSGLPLVFTYNQLISNPLTVLKRFCENIKIEVNTQEINKIIESYTRNPIVGMFQYNTGRITRYESEMLPQEKSYCNENLYNEILQLGYEILKDK